MWLDHALNYTASTHMYGHITPLYIKLTCMVTSRPYTTSSYVWAHHTLVHQAHMYGHITPLYSKLTCMVTSRSYTASSHVWSHHALIQQAHICMVTSRPYASSTQVWSHHALISKLTCMVTKLCNVYNLAVCNVHK